MKEEAKPKHNSASLSPRAVISRPTMTAPEKACRMRKEECLGRPITSCSQQALPNQAFLVNATKKNWAWTPKNRYDKARQGEEDQDIKPHFYGCFLFREE